MREPAHENDEDNVVGLPDDDDEDASESSNTQASAILELFKLKNSESAAFQSHIIRTTILYFAVMGALFKFAFDQNSTSKLRYALSVAGLATSAIFVAAALCGWWYRSRLMETLRRLHEALGLDAYREDLPGIKYSIVLALLVAGVAVVAWVFVLVKP